MALMLQASGGVDGIAAADFRDRSGLGRKRSIQFLEFFYRSGYTRRVRDRHVLRNGSTDFWQRLS